MIKLTKLSLFLVIVGAVSVCSLKPAISSPLNNKESEGKVEFNQSESGKNGLEITNSSQAAEMGLAEHLKTMNIKVYGAYWCPYCHAQGELFGKEAFAIVEYIECDPNGFNSQTELCLKATIRSFPTWQVNGQLYPGMKSLQELAKLSNYQGDQNFQNQVKMPIHH